MGRISPVRKLRGVLNSDISFSEIPRGKILPHKFIAADLRNLTAKTAQT